MEDKVSIKAVIAQTRSSLNMLAVQGPKNARILTVACSNLDAVLEAIAREEAKADDTEKDNSGDM